MRRGGDFKLMRSQDGTARQNQVMVSKAGRGRHWLRDRRNRRATHPATATTSVQAIDYKCEDGRFPVSAS